MQRTNEDCYYFLTASCTKGPACSYRHNPLALTSNVMCQAWLRGSCLDPHCSLRHSAVQRPVVSNGMTCFYENTPMGCLKPDCTYVHLRPRSHGRAPAALRSSTTNLINKEAVKSPPVTNPPPAEPVQTPPVAPEVPAKTEPLPPARPAVPVEDKPKEVITNHVAPAPVEAVKPTPPPTTGNRNVVLSEPANASGRTVVHRVVIAADTKSPAKKANDDTDSDIDLDDLVEQENKSKKVNGPIDISFPCAAPSISNRLFTSSKRSPPPNNTKPIRLNRDRLPATNTPAPNATNAPPSPSNGETASAGTGLPQDEDRRASRLERFKKQPSPPQRSVVDTSRTVVQSKRQAPEQFNDDSPPVKRLPSHQPHHGSTTIGDLCSPPSNTRRNHDRPPRRRRSSSSPSPPPPPAHRRSPVGPTYTSPTSMNDRAWNREVDEFLAKTAQPRPPLIAMPPQLRPMPPAPLRPVYAPPPVRSFTPRQPAPMPRPRQPASTVCKRPPAPPPPAKPVPPKAPEAPPAPKAPAKTEEDALLELDEPSDVVDTFALIDEALFGVDDLLELS